MAGLTEHGLPVVTWLQAETLQALHEGRTAGSIMTERRDRRDTFYTHTRGLRRRGLITTGKQGRKGSVKALVKPRDYLIKGEKPLNDEWLTSDAVELAKSALKDETVCPILADALQDAGCDDPDVLELLRKAPPEVDPTHEGHRRAIRPASADPREYFLRSRKRLLQRIVN